MWVDCGSGGSLLALERGARSGLQPCAFVCPNHKPPKSLTQRARQQRQSTLSLFSPTRAVVGDLPFPSLSASSIRARLSRSDCRRVHPRTALPSASSQFATPGPPTTATAATTKPPPTCLTSSPGTSHVVKDLTHVYLLTPSSIAIVNSDKVPHYPSTLKN